MNLHEAFELIGELVVAASVIFHTLEPIIKKLNKGQEPGWTLSLLEMLKKASGVFAANGAPISPIKK